MHVSAYHLIKLRHFPGQSIFFSVGNGKTFSYFEAKYRQVIKLSRINIWSPFRYHIKQTTTLECLEQIVFVLFLAYRCLADDYGSGKVHHCYLNCAIKNQLCLIIFTPFPLYQPNQMQNEKFLISNLTSIIQFNEIRKYMHAFIYDLQRWVETDDSKEKQHNETLKILYWNRLFDSNVTACTGSTPALYIGCNAWLLVYECCWVYFISCRRKMNNKYI